MLSLSNIEYRESELSTIGDAREQEKGCREDSGAGLEKLFG